MFLENIEDKNRFKNRTDEIGIFEINQLSFSFSMILNAKTFLSILTIINRFILKAKEEYSM
jgi:hypothetical protein